MVFCHGSSNRFRCSPSSLSFLPSSDFPAPEVPDFPVAIPPSAGRSQDSRQGPCLGAGVSSRVAQGKGGPSTASTPPPLPTHTLIHTSTHARAQMRILIHAHRRTHTHNVHMHVYTHTDTHKVHAHTHTHTHAHTHLHSHTHAHSGICEHTITHSHTHTCTFSHTHSHMQTHSYMCAQTNIHALHKHLPRTPLTYHTHTSPAKDEPSWLLTTPWFALRIHFPRHLNS